MKAVIIATGQSPDGFLLHDRYPVPMLPLVDRPFLQHLVEYLVHQGVLVFDWVLCHLPEEIEQFLGTGKRWGAEFRYHLARDPLRPYKGIRALSLGGSNDEPILLGHADRLPAVRLTGEALPPGKSPVLYGLRKSVDEPWHWSGWALFSSAAWRQQAWPEVDEQGLYRYLCSGRGGAPNRVEVPRLLSARNFAALLGANRAVLRGDFPGLLLNGQAPEPDVRLSRNVMLHPSAQLIPPVYIGENCEIAAEARVGPNVFVGPGCVIDRRSAITDSVVLPGTYVGECLELDNVLVDRNRVARGFAGSPVRVEVGCAVASLAEGALSRCAGGLLSRVVGLVLLVQVVPVLLLVALFLKLTRRGRVLHRTGVVRLPAVRRGKRWETFRLWSFCPRGGSGQAGVRHFFLEFLPGLVNVARGDLRLVGLPPRTPEEVRLLGPDWQAFYLQGKTGILSENLLASETASEEEAYATEGVYAVSGGAGRDLGLLLRYLARVLCGDRGRDGVATPAGPARAVEFSIQAGDRTPREMPRQGEQVVVTCGPNRRGTGEKRGGSVSFNDGQFKRNT
jgi:lipopolysaccharide/colanic/teichoic acid biosynthesis glycosyltransferase